MKKHSKNYRNGYDSALKTDHKTVWGRQNLGKCATGKTNERKYIAEYWQGYSDGLESLGITVILKVNQITPEQQTAKDTERAWNIFNRLSGGDLEFLLQQAGIKIAFSRPNQLRQALTVWYHGSIPNLQEIDKLLES